MPTVRTVQTCMNGLHVVSRRLGDAFVMKVSAKPLSRDIPDRYRLCSQMDA